MKRLWLPACGLALIALAAQPAIAQRDYWTAQDVEKRVEGVMKNYEWHRSIDDLKAAAADKGRMMLWIQIVGELDGGL